MPWELDDGWIRREWIAGGPHEHRNAGQSRTIRSLEETTGPETQWIRFRNWRWFGGHHLAETPLIDDESLADWAALKERYNSMPITWTSRLDFDDERACLRCEGVMPDDLQKDLLRQATSEGFKTAVYRLAAIVAFVASDRSIRLQRHGLLA